MNMTSSIPLFILLTIGIKSSIACSCRFRHNQADFCNSDFVFSAMVTNEKEIVTKYGYISEVLYTVKIDDIYKKIKTSNISVGDAVVLSSGGDAAACGVWLTNQTKYLFSVILSREQIPRLMMSSCRWIQEFNTLTESQKRGISQTFLENCECAIGIEIYPKWPGFGYVQYPCAYDSAYPNECYLKHSLCKMTNNNCAWVVDNGAPACRTPYTTEETIRPFH